MRAIKQKFFPPLKIGFDVTLSATLFYSGLLSFYRKRPANRRKIAILLYHDIAYDGEGLPSGTYVLPKYFKRQLAYLNMHYNIISMDALAKGFKGELAMPERPAVISFDGGYKGTYTHAFPLLKAYNVPAIVYVITGAMDGVFPWQRLLYHAFFLTEKMEVTIPGPNAGRVFALTNLPERQKASREARKEIEGMSAGMQEKAVTKLLHELSFDCKDLSSRLFISWQEAKEMCQSGLVDIGSHTINHYRLIDIPQEEAVREIIASKCRIEEEIGRPVLHFCYPDGFFSETIKGMLKTAGYETALTVTSSDGTKNINTPGADLFELKRVSVGNQPYVFVFAVQTTGILGMITNKLKRCLRGILDDKHPYP